MLALNAWSSCFPILTYIKMFPNTSLPKKSDSTLSAEKRALFEGKIKEIALRMKITKPIELVEVPLSPVPFSSFGSNIIPLKMGIFISPKAIETLELTDAECEFLLSHEIAHLKSNDEIKLTALRVTASVITTIALASFFPASLISADFPHYVSIPVSLLFGPLSLASMGGFFAGTLFSLSFIKRIEKNADLKGFEHSSIAAKEAAPTFFEKLMRHQISNREKTSHSPLQKRLLSWIITKEGNTKLDFVHPPLTVRYTYMKAAVSKSKTV